MSNHSPKLGEENLPNPLFIVAVDVFFPSKFCMRTTVLHIRMTVLVFQEFSFFVYYLLDS